MTTMTAAAEAAASGEETRIRTVAAAINAADQCAGPLWGPALPENR